MTERQIGHRKSSLVLSVLFSVVKWRSCSLAKSAYYIVLLACLSRLRVWARGDTWIQTSSLPFLSIQATAGSRPFLWLLFPSALFLLRNMKHCHIAGNFSPTSPTHIGYFEVTWHLTMKPFPAKISERTTLQNLWRLRVTAHCYSRMLTDDRRLSEVSWISSLKISSYVTNHLKTGPWSL